MSVCWFNVISLLIFFFNYVKNCLLKIVLYLIILVKLVFILCLVSVCKVLVLIMIDIGWWNVLIIFLLSGWFIVVFLFIEELIWVNKVVGIWIKWILCW